MDEIDSCEIILLNENGKMELGRMWISKSGSNKFNGNYSEDDNLHKQIAKKMGKILEFLGILSKFIISKFEN